ncbi:hypothetical protein RW03080701_195 [Synechococcus phage S-RIM8]|uniref:Gp200 n=2 Tax=Neptunevirus srim18 TaxID=2734121 RepID=A0A1D7SAT0_9CAUD|nr:gp200 [Synechococcus phage S-RIM8 A.HR1]YP_009783107.1 hypothetical protein HOQ82_gp047 [Synechococcus phage S-RIM8]AFB15458.1 gp200 [Synechococcus phage S-RIM8 A.HR5]AFB17894.1 gp200 [Synechococcus phage S-RIM8 A.HR3]AGH57853.1 hypothetical protein CPJG_00101 [Synechococcus phage KBS-M-1A]AFB17683.1 gp200 [Synechococcus phage S-RIM8 A.HR1]AOO10345.1 hypothetical protein RW01021201_197 [Synechococcus phage S-RIM8]
MPRNELSKDEFEVRVLKLKNKLYNGSYSDRNREWHDGAHHALREVLNALQEYRI